MGDIQDVALLQVVSAVDAGGELGFKIEAELVGDGPRKGEVHDYLYMPHFFCLLCWEEMIERMVAQMEVSQEHQTVYDEESIVTCHYCNSGVRDRELLAQVTSGGLHPSRYTPRGVPECDYIRTKKMDPSELVCIGCLKFIDAKVRRLWDIDVVEKDECDDGTYKRCWRGPKCKECPTR
jgi:hypothetical protein